jgi:two-component system NtrC family response regulator
VRELENRVKRAVVLAEEKYILPHDLGFDESEDTQRSLNLRKARDEAEHRVITRAMAVCDNNVTRAAEQLGISRPSLYSLIKKLGITDV